MGPERTKNALPSAKKLVNICGPALAAIGVTFHGAVYNENPSAINIINQPDLTFTKSINATFLKNTSFDKSEKLVNLPSLDINYDENVAEWLLESGWPPELIDQAQVVVWCESRNDPNSKSPNNLYRGLFGLSRLWFDTYGQDWEQDWNNPVINASVAYKTYLYDIQTGQDPWAQWQCKPF